MSAPMKIGVVCYPTFGGSGVVATELGKALAKENYQTHFITYSQPSRLDVLSENIFYHEVDVRAYPLFEFPPYELALASRIVNVVANEKLDLLHVHYAIPHASAAYLAKQILLDRGIFVPVITTLHGTDITLVGKDASYEPVVRFSINQSDGVTAVSVDLRNQTREFFHIAKDIEVIPNFVNVRELSVAPQGNFKNAICLQGEPLIIHISNFRRVKRVLDVVMIFRAICEKMPAKLIMIGDGPDRQEAEQLCRSLDLCNHVRFLGKLGAVEKALSVADLFLMPSEKESFGLAALEAMACGVPVISSNAGGLPELNVDGVTGFLSPVGHVEEMAANALKVLAPDNLARFKENARQRAKQFDIANILPLYKNYYQRVLQESKLQIAH